MKDRVTHELQSALVLGQHEVTRTGAPFLSSDHPVSTLAAVAMSAVAGAVQALPGRSSDPAHIDRGRTDAWFGGQIQPVGWEVPTPWDPLSAAFATRDGWIRTHANAPRHRAALLAAVGIDQESASRDEVAAAIAQRGAVELEDAIIARGGAAGALRTASGWDASDPGTAVRTEPLIARDGCGRWDGLTAWSPEDASPLAGLRVLDLTRVIAGPACTQVLAGLGADVLRVDPPDWDEPAVLPLVMAGKRSVRLDLRSADGFRRLEALLTGADVLVHGYRAGALERLGLDAARRAALRPGLVEVSERAYGWTGPWTARRGFDSVVQFSTGIAAVDHATGVPVSLPVQALDWATGYLMAAAAVRGVGLRHSTRHGSSWRLSLARTARALRTLDTEPTTDRAPSRTPPPTVTVPTAAGTVSMVASPFSVGAARLRFASIATTLGADEAQWL